MEVGKENNDSIENNDSKENNDSIIVRNGLLIISQLYWSS